MTLEQLINDRKIKAKRHDDLPTLLRLKDMKLRVAYYFRSLLDDLLQSQSAELEISFHEAWINTIPSWSFFEGFSDECLFCTPLDERPGFRQMSEQIERYDLIVCWSMSSLGSIFPDVIKMIKWFANRKVGFYFELEDLYSLDGSFELFLQAYTELKEKELDDDDDSVEKNAIEDCEKLLRALPDWDLQSLSIQKLQALYYWICERHYKHLDIYERKFSMPFEDYHCICGEQLDGDVIENVMGPDEDE